MKRDMDFIRDILLQIEERHDGSGRQVALEFAGRSNEELVEHLFLLNEAGLIHGVDASHLGGKDFIVLRMTWNGHEFLSDVRDPYIWKKAKENVGTITSAGFGLIWELAKAEIKRHLNLP